MRSAEVRPDRLPQPTSSLRLSSLTLPWAVRMQASASSALMAWWLMPGTGRVPSWTLPFSSYQELTIHTDSSLSPYQKTVPRDSSTLIVPVSTEALMVIAGRPSSLLGEVRVDATFRPPWDSL